MDEYDTEIQSIREKAKKIFAKISEFEKTHPTIREKIVQDSQNSSPSPKKYIPVTPRTIESLKEEELDIIQKIERMKKKNQKIREKILNVKQMIEESKAKEQELHDSLDFSYQMRLRIQKKLV